MPGSEIVNANITLWERASVLQAAALMDAHIQRSVAFAKTQRRWDDKTSAAREGLQGKTFAGQGTKIVSSIAHGVDYGVYLELRGDFHKKYAILEKARDYQIGSLIKQLQALFAGYGVNFSGLGRSIGFVSPSYYSGE